MIQYQNVSTRMVYYHTSTRNTSFKNVHFFLKDKGITNNAFMLALLDPDLAYIDPHDPNLSIQMKAKVTREVMCNYWYFLRECIRIPSSGGSVGGGVPYELHRGNLALNFCLQYNLNIMLDLPRQQGKTMAALCWYLYLFNFRTSNSEITFLNKKLDDSKLNLQRLRDLRDALPSYLRMDHYNDPLTGKAIKAPNTVETLQHLRNGNKIRTVPSARNKIAAANLLRGRTLPLIWADEYAFIPYNNEVYTNMVPAFKTASMYAKQHGTPYGILITTTPGILTTDEGMEAFNLKNGATAFDESWYGYTTKELYDMLECNTQSDFVYIKFTYQQLGRDETWFKEICKTMRNDWDAIRREVLLEWSQASSNNPFTKYELETINALTKEPTRIIKMLGGRYNFNIYDNSMDIVHYPPIIGVDVSGGMSKDSSTITVIDSKTTRVIADFNCNYISTQDLARVIYELVTTYMPNAVVNIERNGGFGASVLSQLVNSSIRNNLYYEIKDSVIEERVQGSKLEKTTRKIKKFGSDNTSDKRNLLMEILRQRVSYHKDKFISKRLYDELVGLEVKKSGRVDHSSNTHDDQIFSYLWALYVWYEGIDLAENWHIRKDNLRTDADLDEAVQTLDEKYKPILDEVMSEMNEMITQQLEKIDDKTKLMSDWMKEQHKIDEQTDINLMQDKRTKEAYERTYNTKVDEDAGAVFTIPSSVFSNLDPTDEMVSINSTFNNNENDYWL